MNQDINLTNAAAEYLRELILNGGGSPLTFLCLAVGDGKLDPGVESASRTSLVHEVHRMPVETITKEENGRVYITARLSTDILHSDFKQRELGIYVRNGEGELLLGYVNYGENYDYIPAPGGTAAVYKTITAAFDVMNLRTTFRDLPSDDLVSFTAFNTRLNEVIPIFVNEEFTAVKEEIEESVSQAESIARDAQTSASQALESANAAYGHATTAGINATQAETSAANAAASEFNAKASETAAGTSASSASGSATTASGHASTASAKATQAGQSAAAADEFATQSHASRIASEAAAGRSHTASKNSEASATQAGTARDTAVTAKTAAEAAADRAEAASGGGVTDAQVNTKISAHNTSSTAHSGEMAKKLDKPTGGTTGQVLTKTATGTAWGDMAGGVEFDGDMSGKELKWESDYAVFLRITPNEMVLDRGNYLDVYRKDYGLDPVYPGTSNSYAPLRMYRDRDGGNYYEDQWLSDDRSVTNVGMVKALMGEVDLSDISSSAVKIISGSSLILQNDSYLGLEVTPQGESTLSGDTLTLKSGSLTKTLEELAAGGESGGGDVYFHESTDSQGGAVGPATRSDVTDALKSGDNDLALRIHGARWEYMSGKSRNPGKAQFWKGWRNRMTACARYALTL